MKIKFLTGLTCLLLLSTFTVPAMACPCNPPCTGCQTCEDGVCVDDDSKCTGCQSCSGGSCVDDDSKCDYICCNGVCCLSDESCCAGSCCANACCNGVCCDRGQICCDGICMWPCVEEDDETSCSAVNNLPCIACVGILGNCSNYVTMQYTNAVRWDCTGGCPGECDYVAPPICYRTYECKNGIYYRFAECRGPIPPAPPGPLDCYGGDMPWGCTTCVPNFNALKYTGYTTSSRCQ